MAQGIGPSEAAVLAWADRYERRRLTTDDVATAFGRIQAHQVLPSLARKGLLTRVASGIYLVRPIGALGARRTPTGLAQVGLLLDSEDYYVGGRSAASLHHLTTQRFASVLDVYATRRLHPRSLGEARLVPHPMPAVGSRLGVTTTRAQEIDVRISDPERTILDLVDRPERLLGWTETERLVLDALVEGRVNATRLVRYAADWRKHSTAARLGVLLDRASVDARTLAPLVERFADYAGDTVLVPGGSRRGPWDSRFRVILNDRVVTNK